MPPSLYFLCSERVGFIHPMRAALILLDEFQIRDWLAVMSALLHDVLEDGTSRLTPAELERRFGPAVAHAVDTVTKRPKAGGKMTPEELHTYHERISVSSEPVRLTKLADRLDNIRGCCLVTDRQFQERYLQETREVYLPLAETTHAGFAQALKNACDLLSRKLAELLS